MGYTGLRSGPAKPGPDMENPAVTDGGYSNDRVCVKLKPSISTAQAKRAKER